MALIDSTARRQAPEPEPLYRSAPHNIEAEQALLGALLVNNESFYRVSDFLEPIHFFEPLHQKIFELAGSLIRAGKVATPVTLKTFLPADLDVAGLTASQYLARLAAEATTVINAEDYGRTVYDLAIRRSLIVIGEDVVNVAFDAPVDFSPQSQIEDAERDSMSLRRRDATMAASSGSHRHSPQRSTWPRMPISAMESSPGWPPASRIWIA